MKRNRCVWKAVLALFVAATFSMLTIGCSENGGKQSKPDSAKKTGSDSKKPVPVKKTGSDSKKPDHPE